MNDTSATPSASHSNRHTTYNPCANESNYDNNETPDIVDLYSEEAYNNTNLKEELVLQSRYGLLHYAILISWTGLVIFFSTYLI